MRDRLSDETIEEREARLQRMRDRLSVETVEEREARLQRMRDRLSDETVEKREARLQRMRIAELHSRRDDLLRLQLRWMLGYNSHRAQRALGAVTQSQLPLLHQRSVQAKR